MFYLRIKMFGFGKKMTKRESSTKEEKYEDMPGYYENISHYAENMRFNQTHKEISDVLEYPTKLDSDTRSHTLYGSQAELAVDTDRCMNLILKSLITPERRTTKRSTCKMLLEPLTTADIRDAEGIKRRGDGLRLSHLGADFERGHFFKIGHVIFFIPSTKKASSQKAYIGWNREGVEENWNTLKRFSIHEELYQGITIEIKKEKRVVNIDGEKHTLRVPKEIILVLHVSQNKVKIDHRMTIDCITQSFDDTHSEKPHVDHSVKYKIGKILSGDEIHYREDRVPPTHSYKSDIVDLSALGEKSAHSSHSPKKSRG